MSSKTPVSISKEELLLKYPDPEWRSRFVDIFDLASILTACVLKRKYTIPDALSGAIAVTEPGRRLRDHLIREDKVPVKEAKLLVLLALAADSPLVDVLKTDVDSVVECLSTEIRTREIFLPFILGRELYDLYAQQHEVERRSLNYDETLALLQDAPIGVFQSGRFVTGPYGLLVSSARRDFAPSLHVPVFHCHELTCSRVHATRLSSDLLAPINEHVMKPHQYFEKRKIRDAHWGAFLGEVTGTQEEKLDDTSTQGLIRRLGDVFSDLELRHVFTALLAANAASLRDVISPLGLHGHANKIAERLARAEILQLILICTDAGIIDTIDALIRLSVIKVPRGEVRTGRVNGGPRFGNFGLALEVGAFGVRFASSDKGTATLRLRRLLQDLFPARESLDHEELDWHLRGVPGENLDARLENYVRSEAPGAILKRIILSQRRYVTRAASLLSLDVTNLSDKDIVSGLLWKLGFRSEAEPDVVAKFWRNHDRLTQVLDSIVVSSTSDEERVREIAVNYFVAAEELLDDTLRFSTWALTRDHLEEPNPFNYSAQNEHEIYTFLNDCQNPSGSASINFTINNTLYPLIEGYRVLKEHLSDVSSRPPVYLRDESAIPEYAAKTTLKSFPFRHTVPFLDLTSDSQTGVLLLLTRTRDDLTRSRLAELRNAHLHFRRENAEVDALRECASIVSAVVRNLEKGGLIRTAYEVTCVVGDAWGRSVYTLASGSGREVTFSRPSVHSWLQLPSFTTRQYLMTSAIFAEPNEMLRFEVTHPTEYAELWSRFPKRRKASISTADKAAAGLSIEASSGVA